MEQARAYRHARARGRSSLGVAPLVPASSSGLRAPQVRSMAPTFSRLAHAAQRNFPSDDNPNGQLRRRDIHCLSPPCPLYFDSRWRRPLTRPVPRRIRPTRGPISCCVMACRCRPQRVRRPSETAHLIDWTNPQTNDFELAEEVTLKVGCQRRPDIVRCLNGLAIAVIDVKCSSVDLAERCAAARPAVCSAREREANSGCTGFTRFRRHPWEFDR